MPRPDVAAQFWSTGRVEIPADRRRLMLALLGCVAFCAAGVWIIGAGHIVIGWITIAFFGVIGIPAIILQMVRLQRVVLTSEHIEFEGVPPVPWALITAVAPFDVHGTRIVVLGLTPEGDELVTQSFVGAKRALYRANHALFGGPALALPTTLTAKTDILLELITQAHHQATAR